MSGDLEILKRRIAAQRRRITALTSRVLTLESRGDAVDFEDRQAIPYRRELTPPRYRAHALPATKRTSAYR